MTIDNSTEIIETQAEIRELEQDLRLLELRIYQTRGTFLDDDPDAFMGHKMRELQVKELEAQRATLELRLKTKQATLLANMNQRILSRAKPLRYQ